MGELKRGWTRVKFGDVVRLSKERCADPLSASINRYIGLEHIEPGDHRVRTWGDVAEGTTFTTRVRPGQVLFGKRRAYQRKIAVADFDAVCSGDIYAFESVDSTRLAPGLLPFICTTDAFFDYAIGTSAGSISPRTNWVSLAKYEFFLPSLDEQTRLLEPLYASLEALDAFRLSLDASVAVYSSALAHVFIRNPPSPGIEPRAWAPHDWPCLPLESIVASDAPITYGIVQPGLSVDGGIPTATSNNLNVGFEHGLHFTAPSIEASYSRSRVVGGDILVTVKGFGTGNIAVIPDFFSGNITRDVARLRFSDQVDSMFFLHLWRSSAFERYWRAISVGTTRPELSIGKLRTMSVPWPPRHIREHVSSVLNQLAQARLNQTVQLNQLTSLHRLVVETVLGPNQGDKPNDVL